MSEDWSKVKDKQLQRIKSMKPKDRLDMVQSITEINHYISSSCQGWTQWLYNPMIISQFNQEKLEDTFKKFKEFGLEFLEFDISSTKGLGDKLEKQKKVEKTSGPTYT
jgi:hypothetical protein